MKPRNVDASVYENGGELQVWGVTFTLPGKLYRGADGKIPESARKKIIKRIVKVLESVDFSDVENA